MSEPFYKRYARDLAAGKPLPDGVSVSIGSKGSMFFSDVIKTTEAPKTMANHLWDEEGYCVNCRKDAWDLRSLDPKDAGECPGKPQKTQQIEQS